MKARLAASVVLALGLVVGASGCSMITYQATTEHYDPSDGVSVDVGDLDVRNALVVSEDGVDGNLVLTVVNTSDEDAELGVQVGEGGGETLTIEVGAGESVSLGDDEEPLLLEGIDTQPGGLLPIFFQYGSAEGLQKLVPVLDGRQPEYADLVP
ncbi:hypothetical protein [Agromyces ramosus]|uniref:DNA modification methylase n=1 Tax=Agromyces ramosus TaxID=33879 RepID=A0ABU0R4S1_9MICO|nr:hypothetical protein [Agromyces ramosus]MDQ0893075.1 hypothetical protein [Agromyces ramosus]